MTTIDSYAPTSSTVESESTQVINNPHTLWKQIVGVIISSTLVLLAAGVVPGTLLMLTGASAFADAWKAGIYKRHDSESFLNISPMSWAITMQHLLLVAFPVYLIYRNSLKTQEGSVAYFMSTIFFGFFTFAVAGLLTLAAIIQAFSPEVP